MLAVISGGEVFVGVATMHKLHQTEIGDINEMFEIPGLAILLQTLQAARDAVVVAFFWPIHAGVTKPSHNQAIPHQLLKSLAPFRLLESVEGFGLVADRRVVEMMGDAGAEVFVQVHAVNVQPFVVRVNEWLYNKARL